MEKTGKVSPGPCSQALSFSSLYLLSVTIKSHRLVTSKLGNSETLGYGGMENLLLGWRCSVWSCHTHGSKENNWNNRGFSWFLLANDPHLSKCRRERQHSFPHEKSFHILISDSVYTRCPLSLKIFFYTFLALSDIVARGRCLKPNSVLLEWSASCPTQVLCLGAERSWHKTDDRLSLWQILVFLQDLGCTESNGCIRPGNVQKYGLWLEC